MKIISIIFGNTFLHYTLYYTAFLFTPGCVFPPYFPLLPISYFGSYGLPFFMHSFPFLYFFIYQLIMYYVIKNRALLFVYFIYSFFCLLHIPICDYYWDKNINLSFEKYIYEERYIFPEHMFFINTIHDITFLRELAQKNNKNIIAGIGWYEKIGNTLIEKNGVLCIDISGDYYIREKEHYLRFFETGSNHYFFKNKINSDNIKICSEFFFSPIQRKLLKNSIIIASVSWTKTPLTFFYKNIMKRIYDLSIVSL